MFVQGSRGREPECRKLSPTLGLPRQQRLVAQSSARYCTADEEQWPAWLCEMACNRLLLHYSIIEAQESVQGGYMMHPVVHRWTAHIQKDWRREERVLTAGDDSGWIEGAYQQPR